MREGILRRREGWELVVIINTSGEWSFYSIVQIILIGFSTDFLYVEIFALGRGVYSFFLSCECETATETLELNFH